MTWLFCLALLSLVVAPQARGAGPQADSLYPAETLGFVSLPNVPDFRERWDRTQLGKLTVDPSMKPFADSVRGQFNNRFGRLDEKLGVMIEDFTDIASGEAALGLIGLADGRDTASVAVVVDVTGNLDKARELISKIETKLMEEGANTVGETEGGSVKVYTVPAKVDDEGEETPQRTAACALFANRLIASDDPDIAREIIGRLKGSNDGALKTHPAYQKTMARATKAANGMPATVRWFLSPFEYDLAVRADQDEEEADKDDTITILREQGFDAVVGIGGRLTIATDPLRDFAHHTVIYAPAKPGREGKPPAEKYDLAMRMFDLQNMDGSFTIEPWAPREVASYKTVNLNIQNAFDFFGPLFDAFAGYENAFQTTLDGFEKDPYGPKINLRNEIIEHLGTRVTVMTDYTLPIHEECERYLIVIDVTDENALREPLDKLLESDGALPKELHEVPYWEIVPEEEAFENADFDQGLLPLDDSFDSYEDEREERVIRRAAVCLHQGKLAIGSDVEFLSQALFGIDEEDALERSTDLKATIDIMNRMASGDRCSWAFTRMDESLRPTYELLRQGKMPQSETFTGKFLNRLLTTEDEAEAGADREQQIKGDDLPSFELVRRYLGPSARVIRSVEDGWVIVGVLTSKATE